MEECGPIGWPSDDSQNLQQLSNMQSELCYRTPTKRDSWYKNRREYLPVSYDLPELPNRDSSFEVKI